MNRVPYHHNNQSLALALHAAGFPIIWTERQYTTEDERRFADRARNLAAKDVGGAIYFYHEWDERIPAMAALYDKSAKAEDIETEGDIEPGDIVRIVCQTLKCRKALAEILRKPESAVVVKVKGEATHQKTGSHEGTITHPGMVKVSDKDHLRKRYASVL